MVAFSDEEGVRFQSTFLGSRAFAGTLTPEMLATTDADGTTLGQARAGSLSWWCRTRASPHGVPPSQALVENGAPSEEGLLQEAIRASKSSGMRSYVEAHIEQGPILEGVNQPLAAVIAIAGQTFLTVTMQGSQGHAGTVPMPMRQDTLAAAAEIVTSLERRCQGAANAGLVLRAEEAVSRLDVDSGRRVRRGGGRPGLHGRPAGRLAGGQQRHRRARQLDGGHPEPARRCPEGCVALRCVASKLALLVAIT